MKYHNAVEKKQPTKSLFQPGIQTTALIDVQVSKTLTSAPFFFLHFTVQGLCIFTAIFCCAKMEKSPPGSRLLWLQDLTTKRNRSQFHEECLVQPRGQRENKIVIAPFRRNKVSGVSIPPSANGHPICGSTLLCFHPDNHFSASVVSNGLSASACRSHRAFLW